MARKRQGDKWPTSGGKGELYVGKGPPLTVREWHVRSEPGAGWMCDIAVYNSCLAERAATVDTVNFNVYDQHLAGWRGAARFEHPPLRAETSGRILVSRIDRATD